MEILDAHNLPGPIDIFTDRYIRKHWPEYSDHLDSLYPNNYSLREKLWLHSNRLFTRPQCPMCGNELRFLSLSKGYQSFCCMKCRCNSPEYIAKKSGPKKNKDAVNEKVKKTNLERYGVENVFQSEYVKDKIRNSLKEKYGVEHPLQNPELLKKSQDTYKRHCELDSEFEISVKNKIKNTNKEKYGGTGFGSKTLKEKTVGEIYKKYGVVNYSATKEFKNKLYTAKTQNHTFNTSKIEEEFTRWLDSNNILYKRQYRSKEYPFACDFYFPDKDLYFEINASWTHGEHPFDCANQDDINKMLLWKSKNTKYYDNALTVWTDTDIRKKQTAEENHLNWVAVYSNNLEVVVQEFKKYSH